MRNLVFLFLALICFFVKIENFDKKETVEVSDVEKYRNLTLTDRSEKEKEPEKPASNKKVYIVQKDDSINRIASMYKILPWQLRKANGMGFKDTLLHPGQKLIVPIVSWKSYEGRASWYGPGFHNKKMANGEIYNQEEILIAHRTLPLGLKVRITNLENSKSIVACVLDRGPYTKKNGKYDREVDLSLGAAKALASVEKGIISVKIVPLPS